MIQIISKLRALKPTVAHITSSLATPSNSSLTETEEKISWYTMSVTVQF